MNKNVSFIERNENYHKRYGHLVEGVKSQVTGKVIDQIMQNKMEILMNNLMEMRCQEYGVDINNINIAELHEQTANSGIAYVVKTELAMIDKIFPNLLMNEIASIQPLDEPTSTIFYTDIQREDGTSVSSAIHTNRTYGDNVEYNPSAPQAIKELNYVITSDTITTTEKKLKASITIEVQQDLLRRHGKNAESIMTANLASETVREWDRMGIQAMYDGATGGAAVFNKTEPSGLAYEDRKYWMETLYEKMIDVDNSIFKKRYRKTNFIICGADEAAFIEKMQGFRPVEGDVTTQMIATGGRYFMGTLKNRWRVFVDPLESAGKILMGYNNPSKWEETSFVFAPYILAYMSPWFVNPDTLRQTRAILSRAGMKVVVGDLLGVVTVTSS